MGAIKFRVWDTYARRMFYDVGIIGSELLLNIDGSGYDSVGDYTEYYFRVMQYAGLSDRNARGIYEGDVVNITRYFGGHPFDEIAHVIKRSKNNNNLIAEAVVYDWRFPENELLYRRKGDYEVIGNIYENPELMGDSE